MTRLLDWLNEPVTITMSRHLYYLAGGSIMAVTLNGLGLFLNWVTS